MSITESFCYTAEILYIKYISVKKITKKALGNHSSLNTATILPNQAGSQKNLDFL